MKARFAVACLLLPVVCFAQGELRYHGSSAYPAPESAAVWRSLGASFVRKALKDDALDKDPALNARLDQAMAAVGAAASSLYPGFPSEAWTALLIEGFGHGATAFPGGTVLVDARFVRNLRLSDDELAFVLAHEVAHVVADHPSEKLSFMAETVGRDKAPNARSALRAFFADDAYALLFQPTARLQEREADAVGARIFAATRYDPGKALALFDKLEAIERAAGNPESGTHDPALVRKRWVSDALKGASPRTERR